MKKTMTCPKCQSKSIKIVTSRHTLRMRALYSGITVFSAVYPEVYICSACGYSEEYFSSADIRSLK
jgi:predicted nucleic-acid-binding Zn-ribbon protein